jgi:hypothetical protein
MPHGELDLASIAHVHFRGFSMSFCSYPSGIAAQRTSHESGGAIARLHDEFRLKDPHRILQPLRFRLPIYEEERDYPNVLPATNDSLDEDFGLATYW